MNNPPDERLYLRRYPGVRYALKNSQGHYACVSIPGQRSTSKVSEAARWIDTMNMDPVLAARLLEDPTWRVIRLLDARWN